MSTAARPSLGRRHSQVLQRCHRAGKAWLGAVLLSQPPAAALPPIAELSCERMTGTALLEGLCAHMEANGLGLAGA